MTPVEFGRPRTGEDGCRRYVVHGITFDTRAVVLNEVIDSDWKPDIIAQHENNKRNIRVGLIHQFGNDDHETKIADYAALGHAPWSAVDRHNAFMTQIRNAFASGAYYPALVGAGALGERLLNELVVRLRHAYADHPATAPVATATSFSNWVTCIQALFEWGVLDNETAAKLNDLRKLRNASVHYGPHLIGTDARAEALHAVLIIQQVIEALFSPLGGPPRFISGTTGWSFISLESEEDPFVREFLLPVSVLISPAFRMHHNPQHNWFDVYDDEDYHVDFPMLTDDEFVDHMTSPRRDRPRAPY